MATRPTAVNVAAKYNGDRLVPHAEPLRMHRFVITLSICLAQAGVSRGVTLYDSAPGTLPGAQGWLTVADSATVELHTGQYASLDTTAARADQSGYFSEDPFTGTFVSHPDMPVLDHSTGYTIGFELRVVAESHNTRDDNGDGRDDRAGFSLITISEDLAGLELGFFADRIWAYAAASEGINSLFTQAEGIEFNTTASVVDYQLSVRDGT
jgi:hypothetical protein